MLEQLRNTCRQLLQEGKVDVVIGYGQRTPLAPREAGSAAQTVGVKQTGQSVGHRSPTRCAGAPNPICEAPPATRDLDPPYHSAIPVFITRPDDVGQLIWNEHCHANLAVYLKRPEIRALGRPAIVVKGCDQRALVVLEKESQLDRSQMVVVGMACEGMGLAKCESCDVHQPRGCDIVIGTAKSDGPVTAGQRYATIDAFLKRPAAERLAHWKSELARCVKCYACRQVCPMCYCPRCIVDKNRPVVISTSATLKGNFAWHITRAFHLAARCVGCEECSRACPMGIDLRLLNLSLAQAAEENFQFRAGDDPTAEPVVGAYAIGDKEGFIQ